MRTNVPVKVGVTPPVRRTFDPFLGLRREFDRILEDFRPGIGRFWPETHMVELTPTMDVIETEKGYEMHVELPGMEEKDVNVTLTDGVLTVRGEKKIDHEEKGKTFYMVERGYGEFRRALELPAGTDPETVNATLEKGVLTVTIPKKAVDVKKIEVKGKKTELKTAA